MIILLEFLIVLLCIYFGSRYGGIGLGTVASFGIFLLIFLFRLPPSSPPIVVLLIILSVIIAVSVMEAAGGVRYMITLAERMLRKHPDRIIYYAPLVSYFFTFFTGTGHVAYAVLPVITEVAKDADIRPERPLSISVIASQMAITASPISAATLSLLTLLSGYGITLFHIMAISVPSTLLGCFIGAFVMHYVGVELQDDPVYKARIKEGLVRKTKVREKLTSIQTKHAKTSIYLFLLGMAGIVFFGSSPKFRPSWIINGIESVLDMSIVIQIVMLAVAAVTLLKFKIKSEKIVSSNVAQAGLVAIVSILGIAWLGNIFVEGNSETLYSVVSHITKASPWLFGLALFAMSILLYSQAATVLILIPLGLTLGIPASYLIAMFPAVNGYFFLPTYGTILAAIAFDHTGTTGIGRYVLNHSFMLPGLVATVVAVTTGFLITITIL